jgi:hypothetical protein
MSLMLDFRFRAVRDTHDAVSKSLIFVRLRANAIGRIEGQIDV